MFYIGPKRKESNKEIYKVKYILRITNSRKQFRKLQDARDKTAHTKITITKFVS